ncbi:hypothetical protein L4C36_13350 [Photobacterium japonica]|uniref:hypothetical protein n=1 Tax=Photobacterium japonica TaxID=2910235 RepID=UPI003D0AC1EF
MTYWRTTHHLLLTVLMMISLIITPMFAMSANHAMNMLPTDTTSVSMVNDHSAPHDRSDPPTPSASHVSSDHCLTTEAESTAGTDNAHCAAMDSMDNCQHCDGQHCQYSTLTTLFSTSVDMHHHTPTPTALANTLLTRQESVLRPPIH